MDFASWVGAAAPQVGQYYRLKNGELVKVLQLMPVTVSQIQLPMGRRRAEGPSNPYKLDLVNWGARLEVYVGD